MGGSGSSPKSRDGVDAQHRQANTGLPWIRADFSTKRSCSSKLSLGTASAVVVSVSVTDQDLFRLFRAG